MTLSEDKIAKFLRRSSLTGLCTVYALALSKEKQIAFNFNELFRQVSPNSIDYCYGFAVACNALDLLDFTYKNGIMNVIAVSVASEKVKQKLTDGLSIDAIPKEVNIIEEYFS